MTTSTFADQIITHSDLVSFAADHVNLKRDDAADYRAQVHRLREKLQGFIAEHPDIGLIKLLLNGSLAKGLALKTLNDIDVALYVDAEKVPNTNEDLLDYLVDKLREAYPQMAPEQIKRTTHCVQITFRGSGLTVDVAPVYAIPDDDDDHGYLINKDTGARVLTSILLIDEADALAQSREAAQMHHEDRAGVNAVIRGVDDLAAEGLPALIVMCTNRLDAIDPAVRRRAAATFLFERPNVAQRRTILAEALTDLGLKDEDITQLVELTGPTDTRRYGFTFSDITQRLLPAIILDAFPNEPVTAERALDTTRRMEPTPQFRAEHVDGIVHRATDDGA